jgi:hypothetical protein
LNFANKVLSTNAVGAGVVGAAVGDGVGAAVVGAGVGAAVGDGVVGGVGVGGKGEVPGLDEYLF